MVTTELSRPQDPRGLPLATITACTAALWIITALGSLAGLVYPRLALAQAPRPSVDPSAAAWASILGTNARVLCLPLVLAGLGLARHRWIRGLGDTAVIVMLLLNGGLVGVELGRWGIRLLPYIPQLPVEWLAVGISAAAWCRARDNKLTARELIAEGTAALALLAAAAAVETLLTPHAR